MSYQNWLIFKIKYLLKNYYTKPQIEEHKTLNHEKKKDKLKPKFEL